MKKCTQCGAVLDEDAKFCTSCGCKITVNSTVTHKSVHTENVPKKGKNSNGNNRKNILGVIAIVAVIAIVTAGAGAYQIVIKPSIEQANDYKQAVAFAAAKDYEQAADIFDYLGNYKDSEQKWAETKLDYANSYINAEEDFDLNFNNAKEILKEVEKRQDALDEYGKRRFTDLKEQCENYEKAAEYMENGSYSDAKSLLREMNTCTAVDEMIKQCENEEAANQWSSSLYGYNEYDYGEDGSDDFISPDGYDDDYEELEEESEEENDSFIFPNSSDEYLSASDVKHLSKRDLSLARNEIYARHGRLFTSEKLQNYFDSMDWYDGRYEEVTDDELSQVEKDNIKLIQKYESKKGGSYSWK